MLCQPPATEKGCLLPLLPGNDQHVLSPAFLTVAAFLLPCFHLPQLSNSFCFEVLDEWKVHVCSALLFNAGTSAEKNLLRLAFEFF